MEEKDAEALGRGLAAGLAEALAGALDQTVGSTGKDARRRAAKEQDRAETLRQMRDEALADCRERWKGDRKRCASTAERAVRSYCVSVRKGVFEKGKDDPRVPENINYLRRYDALRKVESRSVIVERLEQTLDLADKVLANTASVDPGAYFAEAADAYRDQVLKLEGVAISEPKCDEAEEHAEQQERSIAEALRFGDDAASASYEDALAAFDGQMEKEFADEVSAFAELSSLVAADDAEGDFEGQLDALSEKLVEVEERMAKRYAESCAASAALVTGGRMGLGDLPRFSGTVTCECQFDLHEVTAFAAEVRRSFATYKQVVCDNGVFVAFSGGSDFGYCNADLGSFGSWLSCVLSTPDDEDAELQRGERGIPSAIEEDDVEGGDSPARATEKLRQLNQKRYFGLLDEDYDIHVDAFWYGFRKLMEFTNGLFKVDLREFSAYCKALQDSAEKRARALGVLMSEDQARDFDDQVKTLAEAQVGED